MLPPKRYDPIKAGIRERIRKEKFQKQMEDWQHRSDEFDREMKELLDRCKQRIRKGNEEFL